MLKMSFTVLLVGLLLSVLLVGNVESTYQRTKQYIDDVVATCNNKNDRRVQIMMNSEGVDVWKVYPSGIVDMRMSKHLYSSIQDYIRNVCYLSIQDVEAHVLAAEVFMLSDKQKYSEATIQGVDSDPKEWFEEYHDFATITEWYKKLSRNYKHLVTFRESIGKTEEGRDLSAVHITAVKDNVHRPKFYMQCLIHAREWISGSVCMYLANELVTGYKGDAKIAKLMNSMEFVIIPIVNPDGYAYTWSADRMWRKNRHTTTSCMGVDLNRNFPTGWEESSNVCSETYSGESIASEKETKAIMQYYKSNGPFAGAIDFHSYGQLVLRPFGFKGKVSKDEATFAEVGEGIVNIMRNVKGKSYTSEKSHDLYEADGIASDWFYSDGNGGVTAMSFTIELRDNGLKGFILPRSEIKATCEEVTEGFMYLAKQAHDRYHDLVL